MTLYHVQFYCNDEVATTYSHSVFARGDSDCLRAAEHIFERLPEMPKDIAGVVVVQTYLH